MDANEGTTVLTSCTTSPSSGTETIRCYIRYGAVNREYALRRCRDWEADLVTIVQEMNRQSGQRRSTTSLPCSDN